MAASQSAPAKDEAIAGDQSTQASEDQDRGEEPEHPSAQPEA